MPYIYIYIFSLHTCSLNTFYVSTGGTCFQGKSGIKSHLCIRQTFVEHPLYSCHWSCTDKTSPAPKSQEDKVSTHAHSWWGEAVISHMGHQKSSLLTSSRGKSKRASWKKGQLGTDPASRLHQYFIPLPHCSCLAAWWLCCIFCTFSAPRPSLIYINWFIFIYRFIDWFIDIIYNHDIGNISWRKELYSLKSKMIIE